MSRFINLCVRVPCKNFFSCNKSIYWPSLDIFKEQNLSFRFYSKKNSFDESDQSNPQSNTKDVEDKNNVKEIGFNYGKYKIFKDVDSPIVLDVEEEKLLIEKSEVESLTSDPQFEGINLNRGTTGVFDIEDLVDVLKKDKAQNVFVATLPESAKYVDYIVVVTGKSYRHMKGLAEYVRRIYKKKRSSNDLIPRIEGENSSDWIALDLGNIALHIFSYEARSVYDLESLWSLGAEYDLHISAPEDPLIAMLQKHAISLDDLKPADSLR